MKTTEIQVGKTYQGRGSITAQREVISISDGGSATSRDLVYKSVGQYRKVSLLTFALWADKEVP